MSSTSSSNETGEEAERKRKTLNELVDQVLGLIAEAVEANRHRMFLCLRINLNKNTTNANPANYQ